MRRKLSQKGVLAMIFGEDASMLYEERMSVRIVLGSTACVLALLSSHCHIQTKAGSAPRSNTGASFQPSSPKGSPRPRMPIVDARITESSRPQRLQGYGSMPLFLPGSRHQQLVRYEVVDGIAVMEGDILLGPVNHLPSRYGLPWGPSANVKSAVARTSRSHLWANSEMPYVIDATIGPRMRQAIPWAIEHMNGTELKLRPRTEADSDYVVFVNGSRGGCSSYVGRIGGPQEIQLEEDCGRGSVVHEILHAAGFYHEQSRGDRDEFVTIHWDEIVPAHQHNFDKRDGQGQDIGPYDYGSIMHYSSRAFSRTGKATITPTKANTSIGQREGLSEHDRAAIAFLYGTSTSPEPATAQWNGSFAGEYSSARGNVSCTQNGMTVNCQYPGGSMLCGVNGTRLDCAWTGAGGGRAAFERQPSGVLEGTYGDFLSANSRGRWDLTPAGSSPGTSPKGPQPPPPSPPPPTSGPVPLAGAYTSSRGPMTCTETATSLRCSFVEEYAQGQMDCEKDASATRFNCSWMTFLPRPAAGRASLTRSSPSERHLQGTWGYFAAENGGGIWEMKGN